MGNWNQYWAKMTTPEVVKEVYGFTDKSSKDYIHAARQVERERKAYDEGKPLKSQPHTRQKWQAAMDRQVLDGKVFSPQAMKAAAGGPSLFETQPHHSELSSIDTPTKGLDPMSVIDYEEALDDVDKGDS